MRFVPALVLLATITGSIPAQPAKEPRLDIHGDPLPDGAIARLGTIRFRPPGDIRSAVLLPGGTNISTIASDPDGRLRIDRMDTATGRRLRTIHLMNMGGDQARFTPDGKHLAVIGPHGITLVDSMTGKVVREFDVWATNEPHSAFTEDGNWMAA
jgi:hypothetical protein